jgi:hypothetical protein
MRSRLTPGAADVVADSRLQGRTNNRHASVDWIPGNAISATLNGEGHDVTAFGRVAVCFRYRH